MTRTRSFITVFVLALSLVMIGPAPVRAQEMRTPGIDFGWFRSSTERAQREACRRNLPECRASVRAQMNIEQSITVIVPWAALGFAILGVLFWLRKRERQREHAKKLARMMHTPASHKKAEAQRDAKRKRDDEDEADRLAF